MRSALCGFAVEGGGTVSGKLPIPLGCGAPSGPASSRRFSEFVGTPGRSPAAAQKGWPHEGTIAPVWGWLKRAGDFAAALMRHLADESAYQRSLQSHGREASPEEWRRFSDARYRARYTQPKCC
jgi:hypothetical protein